MLPTTQKKIDEALAKPLPKSWREALEARRKEMDQWRKQNPPRA